MDLWAALADERRLLADELASLPDAAWQHTTTCGGWTVHELVAHLTVPLTVTKVEPLVAIAKARGNIDGGIAAMTMARATRSRSELLATLRDRAERKFAPPGMGPIAPLSDVLVHGVELRRAVGIERRIAPERARAVLDFLASGKAKGFTSKDVKQRRYEASDLDWSAGPNTAPAVRKPVDELLLVLTGRPA